MNINRELEELQAIVIFDLKRKLLSGEASSSDVSNAIKLLKDNGISQLLTPKEEFIELQDIVVPFAQLAPGTNFFEDSDTEEICSMDELSEMTKGLYNEQRTNKSTEDGVDKE